MTKTVAQCWAVIVILLLLITAFTFYKAGAITKDREWLEKMETRPTVLFKEQAVELGYARWEAGSFGLKTQFKWTRPSILRRQMELGISQHTDDQ